MATPTEPEGFAWSPPRWMQAVVRFLVAWSLRDAHDLRTFIDRWQAWTDLSGQIAADLGRSWWPHVSRDTIAALYAEALVARSGQPKILGDIAGVFQIVAARAEGPDARGPGGEPDQAIKEE